MKDPLNRKRRAACTIINRIIKENITEEYCLKHTGVNKKELLKHLKIPLGKIPRGFEIDHVRKRADHCSEQDFKEINLWWNLRLIPRKDNRDRNIIKKID